MGTKEKYLFVCDRWLADDEDDYSIVREMPAKGPGIKKPLPRKSVVIGSYLLATILLLFYQSLPRLEKYLNLEGFLEKSLKIKSALKSTGKSLQGIRKSLNSAIFCRTRHCG